MIKQCKGKYLHQVPVSKLKNLFYVSIKYDGHYVQIHKRGDEVKFYTSGGKEFYIKDIAEKLIQGNKDKDFIIEAEYIANTNGKLGSRSKAAKLTTYRTNFSKGIETNSSGDMFMVFDILELKTITDNGDMITYIDVNSKINTFETRLHSLKHSIYLPLDNFIKVEYEGPFILSLCKDFAKEKAKEGYEGVYLKAPNHLYLPGKRVNDAIKIKVRPTADLVCIDIEEGQGKYEGMIGSLVLRDKEGRIVKVGSGLSDEDRSQTIDYFYNKVIEIEYEQILDTYIQPSFVRIREDKDATDID